jgi:hypothetical protein
MIDVIITESNSQVSFALQSEEARDFWSYFIGTLPSSNKVTITNRAYANDIFCGMINNNLTIEFTRRVFK